jgi:type I restriction enzyme S subunit
MTALLTDNLPLLAGAPNGIKKLRELILELAVRGKLVPQDPNDEPASELLKRIGIEKSRLLDARLLKKTEKATDVELDCGLAKVPNSWGWVALSDITLGMDSGWSPACEPNPSRNNETWGVLKTTAVQVMQFLQEENKALPAHLEPRPDAEVKAGDILFTRAGPTNRVGISCLVESTRPRLMISDKIIRFHPIEAGTYGRYIALCLNTGRTAEYLETAKSGMAASQVNISQQKLKLAPVPLAPLPEQHRIVAKVDELMALCDRLEAQQADAESAHAQLVQALLGGLAQAADAEDFATSWQRLAEHFHTLFTTESSIDALKQTLLQLAVMGRLVPQDPSDEPASELLKRIAKEKARLVAEGKIRKTKQLPEITGKDKLAYTPNGWESVRFGQVIELISGQHLGPDEYFESTRDGAIPYLTGPADFGETYPQPTRFTNERRATSVKGDILLTVKGAGVGKTNFVDQKEFAISRQLMAIRPIIVDAQFARNMLLSMSAHFHSKSIGIAIPGISREDVLDTLIGIPPLPEQHRIVAKVDQLRALCDQLKTRLTQARQLNEQLATTLVEQAVADDSQQSPNTSDRQAARTLLAAEITHHCMATAPSVSASYRRRFISPSTRPD